jgi:hypothetical protein
LKIDRSGTHGPGASQDLRDIAANTFYLVLKESAWLADAGFGGFFETGLESLGPVAQLVRAHA